MSRCDDDLVAVLNGGVERRLYHISADKPHLGIVVEKARRTVEGGTVGEVEEVVPEFLHLNRTPIA